jgi:Holliday junction DNA helicase RuvB
MSQTLDLADAAPVSLADLIGQPGVTDQVRVALEAARHDDKKFDHALLVGPPGCGKTQTAKMIAAEMGGRYQEVLAQAVLSPADLNALLLAARDKDVILVDEAHEMESAFQTALFLALDQRRVILSGGKGGRTPQNIPLADFTLLLATTDEYKLLQPLRDRMRLLLRFHFYHADDLAELTRRRARALGWAVDDNVYRPIAERARGTPRLALRLLQAARRVTRSEGQDRTTLDHLLRACDLEGIDALGLGPTEKAYLHLLAEGASRLNVIASRMGLPARTVAEVSEPFLLRVGLIEKDEQGRRQLTADGRTHLSQSRPGGLPFGATS